MNYAEIAQQVSQKFASELPHTTIKWAQYKNKEKLNIAEYALQLLEQRNAPTNTLLHVFVHLNIDASEPSKPNKLHTSLAKSLRKRRKPSITKSSKPLTDKFLKSIQNSDEDKLRWCRSKLTPAKSDRHKNRGGKANVGPNSDRSNLDIENLFYKCHTHCPSCHSEMDYGLNPVERGYDSSNKLHRHARASLDRRNPNEYYTDKNVDVICLYCNMVKADCTLEEIANLYHYMNRFPNAYKTVFRNTVEN